MRPPPDSISLERKDMAAEMPMVVPKIVVIQCQSGLIFSFLDFFPWFCCKILPQFSKIMAADKIKLTA